MGLTADTERDRCSLWSLGMQQSRINLFIEGETVRRATAATAILSGILFLLAPLFATEVHAGAPVKLALKFRPGQKLRYRYHESLNYTPPPKFADLSGYQLDSTVDFTMEVKDVNQDGIATVRVTFQRIAVTLDGRPIADLTVFPKQGQRLSATIKPNGEAVFYKCVYLVINNGGQMEYRVSKDGGVIATHTASKRGSEKIVYAADLDEDHGVIRDGVPPTRTLKSPAHGVLAEFKVDLVPVKLFEFVNLPTVALAEGQFFSVPLKYLGNEKLTYEGQGDVAGYQGSKVHAEVSPWTEDSDSAEGYIPEVQGDVYYVIDPIGKLIQGKANLSYRIEIPNVGFQTAKAKIELTLRR